MADDRVRLVAEVTDRFTAPLASIQTAINRVENTSTRVGQNLKKDFEGFRGVISGAATSVQGMLPPLALVGSGALLAAAAVGKVALAITEFSGNTQRLAILSEQTGLTIDRLRSFGALGERYGVSAQTMESAAGSFTQSMSQLRKRYGEAYTTLQAMKLGDVVEKLVSAPNMKVALDTAMDAISKIGDPSKRRKAAELLFNSVEIGAVAGQLPGKVSEVLDEIERRQGATTRDQIAASQEFQKTLSELKENLQGLGQQALGPALVALNDFIKLLSTPDALKYITDEVSGLKKLVVDTIAEFEKVDKLGDKLKGGKWDLWGNTSREFENLKKVLEALKGGLFNGGATIQQQSFGGAGGGYGGLIHRANIQGGGPPLAQSGKGGSVSNGGSTTPTGPATPGEANHMHGQYGDPGSNLVQIRTPGGKTAMVHKDAAPSFLKFMTELEASGYKINSLGGHNHRSIRGSNRLSQHAYGNAIDINPTQNPMGPNLITDMPENVRELAKKYGLKWGGDFRGRKDAMHFEWTGRRPWEDQAKKDRTEAQTAGDALVARTRGNEDSEAQSGNRGKLRVNLHNFPAGTKANVSADDLFDETTVTKRRQLDPQMSA